MAELRAGVVSEPVPDGREWLDHARQVEDAGIDVLLIRDHFPAGAFGGSWLRSPRWPPRPR